MELTDGVTWPLASRPERAHWAAQTVERYLQHGSDHHDARSGLARSPGANSSTALDLAQQLSGASA